MPGANNTERNETTAVTITLPPQPRRICWNSWRAEVLDEMFFCLWHDCSGIRAVAHLIIYILIWFNDFIRVRARLWIVLELEFSRMKFTRWFYCRVASSNAFGMEWGNFISFSGKWSTTGWMGGVLDMRVSFKTLCLGASCGIPRTISPEFHSISEINALNHPDPLESSPLAISLFIQCPS